MHTFVFGPVPSRRLGFSLGVDIIPHKYCNFDCVYCQIGRTTNNNARRKKFFEPDDVVEEISRLVSSVGEADYITFSGSGEPTLNENLGTIIRKVKKAVTIPIAVITNSSLLGVEEVRNDLLGADVVLPSLDAASQEIFNRVNRPQVGIQLQNIIQGLEAFRKQYSGLIWLEIMLINELNDTPDELGKLRTLVNHLKPDKIHLNTVTRPPSEKETRPLDERKLEKIRKMFGDRCEIISSFKKEGIHQEREDWVMMLLETLTRRSLSMSDILIITGAPESRVRRELSVMEEKALIREYRLGGETYYTAAN